MMDPEVMRTLGNERYAEYLAGADVARQARLVPQRTRGEIGLKHMVHWLLRAMHPYGRHGDHALPK